MTGPGENRQVSALLPNECPNCGRKHPVDFNETPGPVQAEVARQAERVAELERALRAVDDALTFDSKIANGNAERKVEARSIAREALLGRPRDEVPA